VDKLAEMSSKDAAPRLLKVLLERHSYADVLDRSILIYLKRFPTALAIPSLAKYATLAEDNGIMMHGLIAGALDDAMEACKKAASMKKTKGREQ
jgi:hypothetical protein